jgi:hypothetical protein
MMQKKHIFAESCLYEASGFTTKIGRLDFSLRQHEGEVKA